MPLRARDDDRAHHVARHVDGRAAHVDETVAAADADGERRRQVELDATASAVKSTTDVASRFRSAIPFTSPSCNHPTHHETTYA
jgi:hypothetical protein